VSFYDNALFIDNLDLVIGIDTVSVILAGAMGKNALVLLSDFADWRWTRDDKSTNWFKSIAIARQQKRGDWDSVLKEASSIARHFNYQNPLERMMQQATFAHQNGNLSMAEKLYRAILDKEPENSVAYHFLGLIAYQTGNVEQAIALITHALTLNPDDKEAYASLEAIVANNQTSEFAKKFLNFRNEKFDISKFSVITLHHELNENEKRLIEGLRKELENIEKDPSLRCIITLYLDILETSVVEGFKSFLQIDPNILSQADKLQILFSITEVQGFKIEKSDFEPIKSFFERTFKLTNFEQLTLDNQIKIIKVFFKFYLSNSIIFKNVLKNYILPILMRYIEFNKKFSSLNFKKNIEEFDKWFQITYICNAILTNPVCLPFLKNELKSLFKLATLFKKNKFEKLDYPHQKLFMYWYTTLRDTIDDSFLNKEYVLLINDTSYHYHPGCFMTSFGIKQSLQKEYHTIIDIPIHEIYSCGEEFLQLNSTNFDNQEIYQLFKINFPIIHKKLLHAKEIIINGEGTIHNLNNHVLFLLYLAYISKTIYAKKVSIINHSPYPSYSLQNRNADIDALYKKIYNSLDFVGIREEYSKSIMDNINVKSSLTFDCSSVYLNSLNQRSLKNITKFNKYIVLSSSVVADDKFIESFKSLISMFISKKYSVVLLNGGPQEEKSFLQNIYKDFTKDKRISFIEAKSINDFLSIIKHATMLISGRFHYSIIAMYLKCPFIILSSNTPKNLGLIKMTRLPNQVIDYQDSNLQEKIQNEFDNILNKKEAYIVSDKHLGVLYNLANSNFTYTKRNKIDNRKNYP